MSDHDNNNFMWFLAGLGFGALLGVLYAPRSGRETRDAIRSTALEGRDYIKTRGKDAKDTVNEWVERGKEVVNRQKDQFGSAFEAGRQAFREAAGDGPTNPKS